MDTENKNLPFKEDRHMDAAIKILIVEDDETLAGEICRFLEKWGYQAAAACQFERIADECLSYNPHLILMDVNLPSYDGFFWCHKIRSQSKVPVIFISSRDDDKDKIMAIAQGGDDYIEKPFHLELLKAKIEALLRRTYQYQMDGQVWLADGICYKPGTSALVCQDQEIELTKSEKRIIAKLADRKSQIVTREELMMELWSTDEFVSDGTLTTIISRLRSKLKARCDKELILTKKGQGYLIP